MKTEKNRGGNEVLMEKMGAKELRGGGERLHQEAVLSFAL